jgi:PEGA domain-containing protein
MRRRGKRLSGYRTTAAAVAAACALIVAVAAARAEEEGLELDVAKAEQARQYFEGGKLAAEKAQYTVAIVAFEEAYRLSHRASVIYALAYSYRQQWLIDRDAAKLKRCIALLREYLEVPRNEKKDRALAYLAELEPALQEIEEAQAAAGKGPIAEPPAERRTLLMIYSSERGAAASLDGGAAAELPLVVEVAAGAHRLRVTKRGFRPLEREVVAIEGSAIGVEALLDGIPAWMQVRASVGEARVAIDGELVGKAGLTLALEPGRHRVEVLARNHRRWERTVTLERDALTRVDASLESTWQSRAGWVCVGSGGAALALGVTASVVTWRDDPSDTYYEAQLDELSDAELYFYAAGVVLGIGGAALLYFDVPGPSAPAAQVQVSPVLEPDGAGLRLGGRF